MKNQQYIALLIVIFVASLQSCTTEGLTESRMLVSIDRLPATSDNMVYELWYRDGDDFTSIERIDTQTGTVNLSVPLTPELEEASTLIVTVEPADLISDQASDTILLAGEFIDGVAQLSVTHPLSMGTDFSTAFGTFRLDTPTSSQKTDFDQGIWWFDLAGELPIQSMFLPNLPQGWIYEAWVIGGEQPLSIGKFPDPGRFDSDLAGVAASDALVAPLFPGQDYVNPPELIPGFTALITVEPQPDFSPLPFDLEILIDEVIEAIDVNQPMENRTERSLPTGIVSRNSRGEQ